MCCKVFLHDPDHNMIEVSSLLCFSLPTCHPFIRVPGNCLPLVVCIVIKDSIDIEAE